MIGRVTARATIVVLALVVIGWLAYDLRGLSLNAQGVTEAQVARSPSQVARVLSLFAQSARDNADPTPRINAARFLTSLGRARRATAILNAVVRTNPGNIAAWSLLAAATAGSDPNREAEANQQVFNLFGHPVVDFAAQKTIFSPAGQVSVAPSQVQGAVDTVRITGAVARFTGWSAVTTKSRLGVSIIPSGQVLILADGRFIAGGTPTTDRPDVARSFRVTAARVGFTIDVPVRQLETAGRHDRVEIFGTSLGLASRLLVTCRPQPQAFGCGS